MKTEDIKPLGPMEVHISPTDINVTRSYSPTVLPNGLWVGIADVCLFRELAEPLGIPIPYETIKLAETQLIDQISLAFPARVAVVGEGSLSAGLTGLVRRAEIEDPDSIVITCDSHLVEDANALDTTRIISMTKTRPQTLGQGQRPGCLSIQGQIKAIKDKHSIPGQASQRVVFVDDVLFDGGTTEKIINELKAAGLYVSHVVVGVSKKSSIPFLTRERIAFLPLIVAPDPIDINNLRDMIGSSPLGGRVYGLREGTDCQPAPYIDKNGISFAAPYLRPNGHPEEWASIPAEFVDDLSITGWTASIQVYEALNYAASRPLVLGDLPRARVRTSYPGPRPKHMTGEALDSTMPIDEILRHKLGKAKLAANHRVY